jgi:hypothetical protein
MHHICHGEDVSKGGQWGRGSGCVSRCHVQCLASRSLKIRATPALTYRPVAINSIHGVSTVTLLWRGEAGYSLVVELSTAWPIGLWSLICSSMRRDRLALCCLAVSLEFGHNCRFSVSGQTRDTLRLHTPFRHDSVTCGDISGQAHLLHPCIRFDFLVRGLCWLE